MAELIVVCAIIAVTVGVAVPTLWTYYQGSAITAAGQQTITVLNSARQLAIRLNTTVCVTYNTTGFQYHQSTCGAAAYTGPGTDAAGYIYLPSGMTASGTNNLCFGYLGAGVATPSPCASNGTLTITRSGGGTINVTMATTGRVKFQ
jgi:Tfp pilus assembly protein FimT